MTTPAQQFAEKIGLTEKDEIIAYLENKKTSYEEWVVDDNGDVMPELTNPDRYFEIQEIIEHLKRMK